MNEVRRHSVYFVDQMEAIGPLYDMIQKGEFVASYGARASGKSTRVDQAMFELERRAVYLLKE
ncbi:8935_t:CDS:2 [Rhizophagus irregularis]|nr:8935_t:CDS:2 [Rhizophagus irregularis]